MTSPACCNKPRCQYCGPKNAAQYVKEAKKRYQQDVVDGFAFTAIIANFTIRTGGKVTRDGTYPLLKEVNDVIVRAGRKLDVRIAYIGVIHGNGEAGGHMHCYIHVYHKDAAVPPTVEDIRQVLLKSWNDRMYLRLGMKKRDSYGPDSLMGNVWVKAVDSVHTTLNYMLINDYDPWKETWWLPHGCKRVRSSRGFLIKSVVSKETKNPDAPTWGFRPGNIERVTEAYRKVGLPVTSKDGNTYVLSSGNKSAISAGQVSQPVGETELFE